MLERKQAILLQDVFSSFHSNKGPRQYGKKGDKVTIISGRGAVLIVEKAGGSRFSVLKEKLLIQK